MKQYPGGGMRPLASLADSVPSAASDAFEGVARGRMRFAQVSGILNAVAAEADIVGLAITEYLPWSVIEFAKALNTLPLLGNGNRGRLTKGEIKHGKDE